MIRQRRLRKWNKQVTPIIHQTKISIYRRKWMIFKIVKQRWCSFWLPWQKHLIYKIWNKRLPLWQQRINSWGMPAKKDWKEEILALFWDGIGSFNQTCVVFKIWYNKIQTAVITWFVVCFVELLLKMLMLYCWHQMLWVSWFKDLGTLLTLRWRYLFSLSHL